MAEWKTIVKQELETSPGNFVEVSLKQPPEGERTYISFSKGWKTEEGQNRYKANIMLASDQIDAIMEVLQKAKDALEEDK